MADDDAEENTSSSRGGWFDRHQKGAWIAAGATVFAALIATLVPVFASSGDDKDAVSGPVAAPSSAVSGPTQQTTPSTPQSPSESSSQTPTATPAGSQLWHGTLSLDHEAKDLDAVPPQRAAYSDEGDIYMLYENEMSGWNNVLIAPWPDPAGTLPGPQECSDLATTQGSRDDFKLTKKTVLCVITSDQNIARLKVSALGAGGALDSRATFDVVIWKAG
ncbi:hypothetical protein ACWGID_20445 [Kribbella sp. NPDC054772]|jgi:hypothetical protein